MQGVSDGGDGDGGDSDGDDGNDAGDNGNDNDDDKKSVSRDGYGAGSTYIRIFTVGRVDVPQSLTSTRGEYAMTPHPFFQLRCGCYMKKRENINVRSDHYGRYECGIIKN